MATQSATRSWTLRRANGQTVVALAMVGAAALAWWGSLSAPMPVGIGAFLLGWVVMMAAMMLPALVPVVRLYQLAARRRTVAPLPVFLAGYLGVWTLAGLPAYAAWQRVQPALMAGRHWTGVVAGVALLAAAGYQLTPAKQLCLRGCRSPLTAFTALRGSLERPVTALRLGARNGLWCLGCCWALMGVLVAVGVMQPWWMAGVAAVIFAEKVLPAGQRLAAGFAVVLAVAGAVLLVDPGLLMQVTS